MTLRRNHTADHKKYPVPSGSPIGWTFYSTALKCWRMWFLRYVLGVSPAKLPEELIIGSIYHALHEGIPEVAIKAWGPQFVEHFEEGKRVFKVRMNKNQPPIPKATEKEHTYEMPKGDPLARMYTSKPDAIEGKGDSKQVREFKTAGGLNNGDADRWAIDGEIIGEMVTTGIPKVVVDIVTKGEREQVSQIEVRLTERNEKTFRYLILDIVRQVKWRLLNYEALKKSESNADAAEMAFPRNRTTCMMYSGKPCMFYDYCWGNGASRALYTLRPNHEWKKRLAVE